MTDKEKILVEIKRKYETNKFGAHSAFRNGKCEALREVLELIDSMQEKPKFPCDECDGDGLAGTCASIQSLGRCPLEYRKKEEPVNEDQEKAAKQYRDFREKCGVKDPVALNEIEEAYYQGTELKKQQLLKYAVLETTVIRDSDGDGIDSELSSWLTLEQTEITDIPESLGLQEGDKVRVYVFKED